MTNPLVAEGPGYSNFTNFTTENNAHLEGAGIFSDAANTMSDISDGKWGSVAIDVVGDGLSALGFVQDPFGSLLAAPIGWIIEHIGFLKEILDRVAGDPEEVRAKAQTWTNISAALDKSAADYDASAKALADKFTGAAAAAYTKAAANYTTAVKGASAHAEQASKAFETAGAIVGTVRGAIRDMFAQFAADALWRGLVALAGAVETFGATIAAWTTSTVLEGISIGEKAAAKILKAVREVSELAGAAGRSTAKLRDAEAALRHGPVRRAEAASRARAAGRDIEHAGSKADAATTRIQSAKEAQARAQQHIDEATTPAQHEAARNELHNAQQRELHQRENYAEAQRELAAARKAEREELKNSREGLHLSEHAKEVKERVEKAHRRVDTAKEAYDNATDDERGKKAGDTAKDLDDGSLV